MTLSEMDYWRLADDLSIVDAAILIVGKNPSDHYFDDDDNRVQVTWQHDGFDASFKALKNAVLRNRLQVQFAFPARQATTGYWGDVPHECSCTICESKLVFRHLVTGRAPANAVFTNAPSDKFWNMDDILVWDEPDWAQTTAAVEELKGWLSSRGVFPSFFFPQGKSDGFRDNANDRYSAKLACAVAAWETVRKPAPNKTVKETILEWVKSNGATFGMADDNGIVPGKAVEEVAKVVNWATKGGATPTYQGEVEKEAHSIANYQQIHEIDLDPPF